MTPSNTFPRTDEESLELTMVSSLPRCESNFSMEATIQKHKAKLDRYQAMNDWLLIVEDMSPRTEGVVIPVKSRYYQFKGMIYSRGEKVKSKALAHGIYVMWGLYNGKPVNIADGLNTWFVREIHVLGIVEPQTKLSE